MKLALSVASLAVIEAAASLLRQSIAADHDKALSIAPEDMSCYYEQDPSFGGAVETGGGNGRSYRGLVSTTNSGRTCQKWTSDFPWAAAASIKPVADVIGEGSTTWGNGIGNHNYCRNPDSTEKQPWCFTMDPQKDHMKELCDIPKCPKEDRDFQNEHKTTVAKIKAVDCQCMDELYGSSQTTKDTAVPLWTGLVQQKWGRTKDGKPCRCKL